MELTEVQYSRIEAYFPRQRGNVSISNLKVLNAILYVAETAVNGEACLNASEIGIRYIRE